jgi:hypothetical protein
MLKPCDGTGGVGGAVGSEVGGGVGTGGIDGRGGGGVGGGVGGGGGSGVGWWGWRRGMGQRAPQTRKNGSMVTVSGEEWALRVGILVG